MKLNAKKIKKNKKIYTFDSNNYEEPIREMVYYGSELNIDGEIYDNIDEPIDKLITMYDASEFTENTFYLYLPYILQCIDNEFEIYVIREKRHGEKYIDTVKIISVRYNSTKEWELKLESISSPYVVTIHKAIKLGSTIFFSKDNANNKLKGIE